MLGSKIADMRTICGRFPVESIGFFAKLITGAFDWMLGIFFSAEMIFFDSLEKFLFGGRGASIFSGINKERNECKDNRG